MAAAQHKLSRREVLAGACAVPALPLHRHCEERSDAAIQCDASTVTTAGLLRSARNDEKWSKALALYARAEAAVRAVAQSEDDDLYDRALGRHNAALARLLRTAAPDLPAVSRKLELILRHQVFELTFGEAAFEALERDVERFARLSQCPEMR